MGCNASKAFVPEPIVSTPSEKPGLVTGDSFVGWLFGLPPTDATVRDTGYGTHSTASQAVAVPSLAKEPQSRKVSISALDTVPALPTLPYPSHQPQMRQQTGLAI